jgi:hypothetical protein
VSVDLEDQVAGEEPLRGHRARRCHAAGRPNGIGRHHQRGAAGDAGFTSGEGDHHRGVGGSHVFADWQGGCLEREGATVEDIAREHPFL